MAKNRAFLKMGPTDEFQTKFSGFSIQFWYRNCKNLKRVHQLNWNIDAVYCAYHVYVDPISVLDLLRQFSKQLASIAY